ncbi:transporter, partial [Mesorhizobium sp. M7A.T.Ca.US.000.02.2.1]
SRVGGIVALKEYPAATAPGFINKLLSLPFEFVLTQSFRFIPKQSAIRLLTTQQNKMVQSGEVAESLVVQLSDALDDLSAGRFAMGEHHLSLTIFGASVKELSENIAEARSNLSDSGAVAVREDWGVEAAFWAQLPAN